MGTSASRWLRLTMSDFRLGTHMGQEHRLKKPSGRASIPPEQRLLIDRRDAAQYLSISQRSLDYLLAQGELHVRRIGSRVLIPLSELQRYARIDHPKRIAS